MGKLSGRLARVGGRQWQSPCPKQACSSLENKLPLAQNPLPEKAQYTCTSTARIRHTAPGTACTTARSEPSAGHHGKVLGAPPLGLGSLGRDDDHGAHRHAQHSTTCSADHPALLSEATSPPLTRGGLRNSSFWNVPPLLLAEVRPSPGPTWALDLSFPQAPSDPVMTPRKQAGGGFIDTDVPVLGLQSSLPALEPESRGAQSVGGSSDGSTEGLLLLVAHGLH